ncbi:hypothetical protein C8R46DRAFT_1103349 [Mycena filopes]|nr:hypothetical protein C8R46DRAFT_1103349 [Mycena filopes]
MERRNPRIKPKAERMSSLWSPTLSHLMPLHRTPTRVDDVVALVLAVDLFNKDGYKDLQNNICDQVARAQGFYRVQKTIFAFLDKPLDVVCGMLTHPNTRLRGYLSLGDPRAIEGSIALLRAFVLGRRRKEGKKIIRTFWKQYEEWLCLQRQREVGGGWAKYVEDTIAADNERLGVHPAPVVVGSPGASSPSFSSSSPKSTITIVPYRLVTELGRPSRFVRVSTEDAEYQDVGAYLGVGWVTLPPV